MNKLMVKLCVPLLILAVVLTSCAVENESAEATGETLTLEAMSKLSTNEQSSIKAAQSTLEEVSKATNCDYTVEVKDDSGKSFSILTQNIVDEYNKDIADDSAKVSLNKYCSIKFFIDYDSDSSQDDGRKIVKKSVSYVLAGSTDTKTIVFDSANAVEKTSDDELSKSELVQDIGILKSLFEPELDDSTTKDKIEVEYRDAVVAALDAIDSLPEIKVIGNVKDDGEIEAEVKISSSRGGITAAVAGTYKKDDETVLSLDTSVSLSISDDFNIINPYTKQEDGKWKLGTTKFTGSITVLVNSLELMLDYEDSGKIDVSGSASVTLDTEAETMKVAANLDQSLDDKPLLSVDAEYEGALDFDDFDTDNLKIYKFEIGGTAYSAVSVKTIINAMLYNMKNK